MKKIFLLFGILFAASISGYEFNTELNKVICDFLRNSKKKGVYPNGIGGGSLGEITNITVHLVSCKDLDIEKARLVYMEYLEDLLQRIHSNKKLRPHLHTYPLTTDTLDLLIGFRNKEGDIVPHPYVGLVFSSKGKVIYSKYDGKNECFFKEKAHVESLQEAWEIYHKYKLMVQ